MMIAHVDDCNVWQNKAKKQCEEWASAQKRGEASVEGDGNFSSGSTSQGVVWLEIAHRAEISAPHFEVVGANYLFLMLDWAIVDLDKYDLDTNW